MSATTLEHPGWEAQDCGLCCGGIEFTVGHETVPCRHCAGGGFVWVHLASGVVALWPGGPFNGERRPASGLLRKERTE